MTKGKRPEGQGRHLYDVAYRDRQAKAGLVFLQVRIPTPAKPLVHAFAEALREAVQAGEITFADVDSDGEGESVICPGVIDAKIAEMICCLRGGVALVLPDGRFVPDVKGHPAWPRSRVPAGATDEDIIGLSPCGHVNATSGFVITPRQQRATFEEIARYGIDLRKALELGPTLKNQSNLVDTLFEVDMMIYDRSEGMIQDP